jgi:HlyD family secretion protein
MSWARQDTGFGPSRWAAFQRWFDARFAARDTMASRFQTDARLLEELPVPLSAYSALYVILALIAVTLAWAMLGSVDRIVVAQGRIATSAPVIVMQPFTTSRILKLHVKAGDRVRKGQLLITFDPAFAQADQSSLAQKNAALTAEVARMEAELAGAKQFEAGNDPERRVQAQLFLQRSAQFAAEMQVRDSRLGQVSAQLDASRRAAAGLERELAMAQNVVGIRRNLEAQQAGARLETMQAEKDEIDVDLKLKSAHADIVRLEQQYAEIAAERRSWLDQWRADLNQKLVAGRQDLAAAQEGLSKAGKMKDLTELRAPADGVVLELAERSEGSVMREAETLLTLVPADAELTLEANIPSRDIGYVKVGDMVRVKLEAYPFQRFGTLDGIVETVSPDSVVLKDGDNNVYFHTRVRLTGKTSVMAAKGIRLRPGLVATAEIKSGRRSVISYLSDPILKTGDESLREP